MNELDRPHLMQSSRRRHYSTASDKTRLTVMYLIVTTNSVCWGKGIAQTVIHISLSCSIREYSNVEMKGS